MVENGGDGLVSGAETSGGHVGEWQDNGAASVGNDWEKNNAETSAFGGGAPIAATGDW